MDQKNDDDALSGSTAKLQGAASDFAAQTKELAQETREEARPILRNLQSSAGDAMNKATDLARKVSNTGIQAATQASDAIQGAAREVGRQAYQQGARAQGDVTEFVAEQPLAALLIAGAIGYGLAYVMLRRSA
jgi:ElaB/YqjD/DUF883 family membrane-anchored ribosome-binding protein